MSVDTAEGVSTGSSAADRATTLRVLADPASQPQQLTRPGYVFPLRAAHGGVLARAGRTEAAVDLARLAGLPPVAVLAEIVRDDGELARTPDLVRFAADQDLRLITIRDLISHRWCKQVERVAEARIPLRHGNFRKQPR